MMIITGLVIGGIIIVLILNSMVIIPTFKIGLVRTFKRIPDKNPRKLEPGLRFILPFVQDVLLETAGGEPISTELRKMPLEVTVISKDNQKIVVGGTLFFKVDPSLVLTFAKLGKDLLKGVVNAIESELGVIAGAQTGDDFIKERQAIQDLVNCVLRMKKPPHQRPEEFQATPEDVKPERRLKFYKHYAKPIKNQIKNEKQKKKDISTVEKRFGIDIETFELTKVSFSEEIMKAREQQEKAKLEMKAAEERQEKKIQMLEILLQKGVPVQEAVNLVESSSGAAERKIISVEGGGSSLETAAAIIAGGGKK